MQQDKVSDIEGKVQNMERNFVQQMKLLRLVNGRINTVLPSKPDLTRWARLACGEKLGWWVVFHTWSRFSHAPPYHAVSGLMCAA